MCTPQYKLILTYVLVWHLQNEIPDFKEFKNSRQSNTSPARNRRGAHDNKNTPSKAALKRNLFGDNDEDQSSLVLAKQLIDSPQQQQPCPFLNDPAIQSIKCTDFSYKMQSSEKEVKGTLYLKLLTILRETLD